MSPPKRGATILIKHKDHVISPLVLNVSAAVDIDQNQNLIEQKFCVLVRRKKCFLLLPRSCAASCSDLRVPNTRTFVMSADAEASGLKITMADVMARVCIFDEL